MRKNKHLLSCTAAPIGQRAPAQPTIDTQDHRRTDGQWRGIIDGSPVDLFFKPLPMLRERLHTDDAVMIHRLARGTWSGTPGHHTFHAPAGPWDLGIPVSSPLSDWAQILLHCRIGVSPRTSKRPKRIAPTGRCWRRSSWSAPWRLPLLGTGGGQSRSRSRSEP